MPTSANETYRVSLNSPPSVNALGEVALSADARSLEGANLGFRILLGNQILGNSGSFSGCGD